MPLLPGSCPALALRGWAAAARGSALQRQGTGQGRTSAQHTSAHITLAPPSCVCACLNRQVTYLPLSEAQAAAVMQQQGLPVPERGGAGALPPLALRLLRSGLLVVAVPCAKGVQSVQRALVRTCCACLHASNASPPPLHLPTLPAYRLAGWLAGCRGDGWPGRLCLPFQAVFQGVLCCLACRLDG